MLSASIMSLYAPKEEGVKEIERMNAGSYEVVNKIVKKGATLMAAESVELLGEFMDWNKCLSARISNQKVITKVYEFYNEALKNREEWIQKGIDLTLGEDEFGLLVMRENNKIQFPSNVEVFYVAPPSLDEIKRWVRDKKSSMPQAPKKEENRQPRSPQPRSLQQKRVIKRKVVKSFIMNFKRHPWRCRF